LCCDRIKSASFTELTHPRAARDSASGSKVPDDHLCAVLPREAGQNRTRSKIKYCEKKIAPTPV